MKKLIILTFLLMLFLSGYFYMYPLRLIQGDYYHISPIRKAQVLQTVTKHCSHCHLLPTPHLLPLKSWQYILTYMGLNLGHRPDYKKHDAATKFQLKKREQLLEHLGKIPKKSVLTDSEWADIEAYYYLNSPREMPSQYDSKELTYSTLFETRALIDQRDPAITLLKVAGDKVYVGSGFQSGLSVYSKEGLLKNFTATESAPIDMDIDTNQDSSLLLTIGDLIGNQVGQKTGRLLSKRKNNWQTLPYRFSRPISMLHHEGSTMVAAFGAYSNGGLYRLTNNKGKETLLAGTGYLKVLKTKMSFGNGFAENSTYLTLRAESREAIIAFDVVSKKNKTLVEFEPSTGLTTMFLADLNKDNIAELIAVAGDNADSGPYNTIKKTHGIYIYQYKNENYRLKKMLPFQGAYTAQAADFDLDGDIDIIAGSSFADIRDPLDIMYFENQGDFMFVAKKIDTISGRYTLSTLTDIDHDGDIDVLFAKQTLPYKQYINETVIERKFSSSLSNVVFLENRTK